MASSQSPIATHIILPDLMSICTYKLHLNPSCTPASESSEEWLTQYGGLDKKQQEVYHALRGGLLTSYCYPDAEESRLRICCDFINWLFRLDDITDDMDHLGTQGVGRVIMNSLKNPSNPGTEYRADRIGRDFSLRLLAHRVSQGSHQRFFDTMDLYFQAVATEAANRERKLLPGLEEYIALRRNTSACKPAWALIEFANGLAIPDEVMEHKCLFTLGEAANDLVTWANDIFSYNVEQARGDTTHNMVPVVMAERNIDVQEAVDFVGAMCQLSFDRFNSEREKIPSWGPEIDWQVAAYTQGLADWMAGNLHWSFESERYFGKTGQEVKQTRRVELIRTAA